MKKSTLTNIEIVSAEVQKIIDKHGKVTPSKILDIAKNPKSRLHACFEWDNAKAAGEHRLLQARGYIKKVRIIFEGKKEQLIHIPVSVLEDTREGEYKPVSAVVRNQTEFEIAYAEALSHFRAAERNLRLLTKSVENEDHASLISLAMKSLSTAETAIRQIVH